MTAASSLAESSLTATTAAARAHARAQHTKSSEHQPIIPASSWPAPPAGVDPAALTWAETVPGGRYTSKVLTRGTRLRIRDLTGTACAQVFLWRADNPSERLNVADTVKVPWQAYLGKGHPLLSEQGRVLATIVSDTSGKHDALCGASHAAGNAEKYGPGQGSAHSDAPAGRELLILAALKNGLRARELAAPVNFFHGVSVAPDGSLSSTGTAGPDTAVELVAHLPLIVAIANTAHPLDPATEYTAGPIEVLAWHDGTQIEALAATLESTEPEYQRAFANTEDAWSAIAPAAGK